MRHTILTESAVAVRAGDDIVVSLEENASTGYVWRVDALPGFLKPVGDHRDPPSAITAGALGERRLEFRVTGIGEGALTLSMRRPWEQDTSAAQKRIVVVTARA